MFFLNISNCNFSHRKTDIILHIHFRTVKEPTVVSNERAPSPPPPSDTIVKHIHFVNEKKDVALQLSRNDLPPSSNIKSTSAQTRWTSTKNRPIHHSKDRYLRTIDDL